MTCINCAAESEGKYCPQCAQPLVVKRLTFKEGLLDFWARIYGFDGMFPRTFRDLTIRPGFAALEFIKGNRARYYGPVGYFFLMITCFLLLLSIIGLDFVEYLRKMQEVLPAQRQTEGSRNIQAWVADNIKIMAFIMIPVQAFCARYVFFRKQQFNFIEHAVLPLYVMGHWYWVQMVESVFLTYWGMIIGAIWQWVLMSLYMGFGYTSFITTQPKWKTFLKGMGVYMLGMIMIILTLAIVIGIAAFIMYSIDPSSLDSIRPSKMK